MVSELTEFSTGALAVRVGTADAAVDLTTIGGTALSSVTVFENTTFTGTLDDTVSTSVAAGVTLTIAASKVSGKVVTGAGAIIVQGVDANTDLTNVNPGGGVIATLETGINISGNANLGNADNFSIENDADVTITIAQHAKISAAAGDNTVTLSANGTITGNALVENYILAAGNNNFTMANVGQQVTGNTGSDNITGGLGNDVIFAGAGSDNLSGGLGNDRISGGQGGDILTGGDGDDIFVFASGDTSTSFANDVITDFISGEDKFDFGQVLDNFVIADGVAMALSDFLANASAFFAVGQANAYIAYNVGDIGNGLIAVDHNQDGVFGAGDSLVQLIGVNSAATINANDFDVTPPSAPTSLDLAAADDTGTDNDNITTQRSGLTITGTAEANAQVELFDGSTSLGTTTADGSGAFSLDVTLALGAHSITATATDGGRNVSAASAALVITVNLAPIAAIELSAIQLDANVGGFVINGAAADDKSGFSVSSAGDVNGDGFDDLIVGAHDADPAGVGISAGASYVVFGKTGGTSINLSDVASGTGGFVINGASSGDRSGLSVSSAGDVNGDGLDDLIVGAPYDDPNGAEAGASFVVFGKADGALVDLSAIQLNGNTGGFVINGVSAGDFSGRSVSSAGDVNGDGLDDLIVGAINADPNGNNSGASYVVFGKSDGTAVDLSAIEAGIGGGFVINGVSAFDFSGRSVSSAGDVNGDGFDDLIVGAPRVDPNGIDSGASYVVFGKSDGTAVELSAVAGGTGGFVINGALAFDYSGFSVSSAGDVNGDGVDDLIVGAKYADPNAIDSGASYVVFGKSDGTAVELSAVAGGTGGFVINGASFRDLSGYSVSSAGDMDGDGLDDLIVGARAADPNGNYSGASYVVFGKSDGTAVDLSAIEAGIGGGFVMNGVSAYDSAGFSVSSAGDVNGDGFDDVIVGARYADPNGGNSGASYVVFGRDFTDVTPPPAPGSLDLAAADDTGTDNDNITTQRSGLTITGILRGQCAG
ncbi:MAG: beta strand repeat-containing protein [Polymorphobacter sp.]|uniref:beta strand repeat-containing protein n=1 Tax=Polymorphobacter sp. TaxID=1909290 RepID=UPI003A868898